jgi:glycosyltransferase XagB
MLSLSYEASMRIATSFSRRWLHGVQGVKKLLTFLEYPHVSEKGELAFGNTRDFLFLPTIHSAEKHLHSENISLFATAGLLLVAAVAFLKVIFGLPFFVIISGTIALFYATLMVFKLWVVQQSLSIRFVDFNREEIAGITDKELPTYTVLVPLYQEERVIRQTVGAITALNYPADKLQVLVTLEEYDYATRRALERIDLPKYVEIVALPNVEPKTKPKALNVAFLKARGEFVVIYDAEVIPEENQLKKAHLAFKKNPHIASFQTRLDHYNTRQNIITRLFNTEFSFYYDLFLPGLQKLGYPIPLSGHSTHFRTEAIRAVGAWDPYNVTEDCDLGIRLHRKGYQTGVLNSFSYEEATSTMRGWMKQRTRWMKGFIQTAIVHLRHPLRLKNELGGYKNFFVFLLVVPGTVLVNIFNIVYWGLLIGWLTTRSELIQEFFPQPILYISVISFLVGNFIFTYLNLLGAYQRSRYDLVKYSLLSPLYWIMLAVASLRALGQLAMHPHLWEKTAHGDYAKADMRFEH